MVKKTEKACRGGCSSARLMQAFLKVDCLDHGGVGSAPSVVLRPLSDVSYPANLVPLEGVVIGSAKDFKDGEPWSKDDAWMVCSKVSEACKNGAKDARSAYCEHLAYAYSILCDCVKECDGDWTMSKETWETLIRGAIDRIVRAGKCFGLRLDQYRSDD